MRSNWVSATPPSDWTELRTTARQIDRLVTGLFDYARADLNSQPTLQTTDLADTVTDVAAAFGPAADEQAVRLHVTAHAGVSVRIERDSVQRALPNVIDNAVRYTPPRGTIEIGCGENGDDIFVRVADDGPGIPPNSSQHIQPTVRADLARHHHTYGLGLGLTIAARQLRNTAAQLTRRIHPHTGPS